MKNIALVAINARYSHSSLGARCLLANIGPLRESTALLEFTIQDDPILIAEQIAQNQPALVAIGVYIWNRTQVESLVTILRKADQNIPIVLGGPEITYDLESHLAAAATCVICGEADLSFRDICEKLLIKETVPHIIPSARPPLEDVALPYDNYSEDDLAHRMIYAETSRGCAYACEYCISSIEPGVRPFPLKNLLPEFDRLIARGARRFKFVDRSFNLHPAHACAVLDFFLQRWQPGMCLHLEMTPDRLAADLRERLLKFTPGSLHIEVGIQTFNTEVARRVGRTTDLDAAANGIRFLVDQAKADVHADLIAGLPGETPEVFEAGFNRLAALHPAEIQVGILKRLHGAPIERHVHAWDMIFRSTPPYDVISTSTMDEVYMKSIRRFGMHWDRLVNRGWFPLTMPLLLNNQTSIFKTFDKFSCAIENQLGLSGFGLVAAARILLTFLTEEQGLPPARVRQLLREDYLDDNRRINVPNFLRPS